MFRRYTERAQQTIVLAQDEARRLRYGYVGTEHLLLGLLRDAAPTVTTAVLQEKGITLEWLRRRLASDHPLPG